MDPKKGSIGSVVRLISKRPLREFWANNPDAERPLRSWIRTVRHEDWDTPQKVIDTFPKARILGDNRVLFNIRGNHYRLIVKVNYRRRILYVRFVGTHAQYDRINAEEV